MKWGRTVDKDPSNKNGPRAAVNARYKKGTPFEVPPSNMETNLLLLVQVYIHLRERDVEPLLVECVVHPLIHIEIERPVV